MKYYLDDDLIEMNSYITEVKRCDDEGCYRVVFATGVTTTLPLTDEVRDTLEVQLEEQVLRGYHRIVEVENKSRKAFNIHKAFKIAPIITGILGTIHWTSTDDLSVMLPYVLGMFAFSDIGKKYRNYDDERLRFIVEHDYEIKHYLKQITYKEQLADFIYHSEDVKKYYQKMPNRYQQFRLMIENDRNPFSLVEDSNVLLTDFELDSLIHLYHSSKNQEVSYHKKMK